MKIKLARAFLLALTLSGCSDSTGPEPPAVGAVALNLAVHEMEMGETVQLAATVVDTAGRPLTGRAVTWSSSDPDVAAVSSGGLVTGVGPGVASVTAASEGKSAQLAVTVLAGECRAEVAREASVGRVYEGALERFDCVLMEGPFADGYAVTVERGLGVSIGLESVDFDALLLVTTRDLQPVAFNDDNGFSLNSALVTPLPPGEYIVWATALARPGEGFGSYTLTVAFTNLPSCDPIGSVAIGGSVEGSLRYQGCFRGGLADAWTLDVATPGRLQIELSTGYFIPTLELSDGNGTPLALDVGEGADRTARLAVDVAAGPHLVWVSSFGDFGNGPYRLGVASSAGTLAPPQSAISQGTMDSPWTLLGSKRAPVGPGAGGS